MNEVLITSSVLIVALLILRTIFAKKVRRTWIYAAWLLVALRLLVPVQVGEISFSVLTMAKPLTETVQAFSDYRVLGQNEREAEIEVAKDYIEQDQTAFTPQVQEYIQKEQAEGTSTKEIATALVKTQGSALYVPEMQTLVAEKVEAQTKFVSLGEAATIVWLMGVVAMVVWLAVGNLQLGRSLKSTEITVECESPIPVYISETAVSPCLFGLFRPAVYLTPESAADAQVMRHVVTHELTHYAHKDHIWALVRCICLCVYWFNPLVWVAAWFSRRDCELACDEGALKHLDEAARIDYGKALLQVVSQSSVSGRLMLTATTMAETKKQLKERVDFIVKKRKWSMIAAICMVLVCVTVAGCTATGPADGTGAAEKKPWDISEEEQTQLKQKYVEYMSFTNHSCTAEDVKLVVISKVESGYAVVIGCKCGSINFNSSWQDLHGRSAGDLQFYMPDGWHIQFCKDGEFRSLSEAYNLGWLNYEQLRVVWDDFHAQFPKALEKWQQVYGQSEPPQRDSGGLDYEVNEDGVTCTVTGMGVCNDTDVIIPEYIDGYQVTAIGNTAFWSKIFITSVTMPDSVVRIERSAFEECEQLKSITLSASLEIIGLHAFKDCKALVSIQLPDSLTLIDGGAFSGCSSLTELMIPDGVTVISSGMVSDCKNLRQLSISGNVTEIQEGALAGCSSLVAITYRGTMEQWNEVLKTNVWWYTEDMEWLVVCSDGQVTEEETQEDWQ